MLTTTAKNINSEFQGRLKTVMSRFGDFRAGPVKAVERCQSKLENEYQGAVYPKAARLLDLVRCSVSFNTLEQLLAGYDGLMDYVKTTPRSFQLARVKNGFLDKEATVRDIKVNVVFHSETADPDNAVSMVCEVQLILNQYLHEKKRIHKLYSVLRERAFFELVAKGQQHQGGDCGQRQLKDLKQLQFEPVLNVKEDVKLGVSGNDFWKCSADSELGLLGKNAGDKHFFCVELSSKKVIFKQSSGAKFGHNWVVHKEQKYLSLQTAGNTLKMFKFGAANTSFDEEDAFTLCLNEDDTIQYSDFDENFENIFIVKNSKVLETRKVGAFNEVALSIQLVEKCGTSGYTTLFALSAAGTLCAIGFQDAYFYLVDLESQSQHKLASDICPVAVSPCFINGDTSWIAVGGNSKMEIWNIEKMESVKVLEIGNCVCSSASTNNILAVGSQSKNLQLWDARNWQMFHSLELGGMMPQSVHLTRDARYLTIGGFNGELCVVLEIQ